MNSTALTNKPKTYHDLLHEQKGQISLALPKHIGVDADKMIRIALTAINSTPKLQGCDPVTVLASVIQAAQVGLVPDGFLGQAYLVPFWNKKRQRDEAKLMIGYRGFIELAVRSGKVRNITAEAVYDGDNWTYELGLKPVLRHVPKLNSKSRTDSNIIAAYAIAYFKDGGEAFVVLDKEEVEAARASSQSGDSGPWKTHYVEMAKKTAVRRLAKYLSLSPESVQAAVIDEYNDQGYTLEGDPADLIPSVPAAVEDKAAAKVRERVEAAKAKSEIQTEPEPEPTPEPEPSPSAPAPMPVVLATDEGHFTIEGIIEQAEIKTARSPRPTKYAIVTVASLDRKLYCYKADWHGELVAAIGKSARLYCELKGEYAHIVGIGRLGEQKYEAGVPIIQRGSPSKEEIF